MTKKQFLDIMNDINDGIIKEYLDVSYDEIKPKKLRLSDNRAPFWKYAAAFAAGICVVAAGFFAVLKLRGTSPIEAGDSRGTAQTSEGFSQTESQTFEQSDNSNIEDNRQNGDSIASSAASSVKSADELFIERVKSLINAAKSVDELNRSLKSIDSQNRIKSIKVFANSNDYSDNKPLPDGDFTVGTIIKITYNNDISYVTAWGEGESKGSETEPDNSNWNKGSYIKDNQEYSARFSTVPERLNSLPADAFTAETVKKLSESDDINDQEKYKTLIENFEKYGRYDGLAFEVCGNSRYFTNTDGKTLCFVNYRLNQGGEPKCFEVYSIDFEEKMIVSSDNSYILDAAASGTKLFLLCSDGRLLQINNDNSVKVTEGVFDPEKYGGSLSLKGNLSALSVVDSANNVICTFK